MSDYVVSDSSLEAVADAIRAKGGTSAQLEFPADFVLAIGNIPSGSLEWPFAVLCGSITPASDVQNLTIGLEDIGLKYVIASFGTTDYNDWPDREHTTEYEKMNTCWCCTRFKRLWPSTVSEIEYQGFYLDANANGHSWKSNSISLSLTQLKVGYSGYKWKAGVTVHWLVIGVK